MKVGSRGEAVVSRQVIKGASGRGAAGGDLRFSDIPSELIDACLQKLDQVLKERTIATPLLRGLRRAIKQERLVLPVVSSTLGRVFGLLEREDVRIADLALAIEADPVLATKVVGVANSGFYGGIDSVVSVENALMRTGLEQAKNIVAGVAIRSSVFTTTGFNEVIDLIWRRSMATALASLALLEDNPETRDSAFLLGLVHDIGRTVLLATSAPPLVAAGQSPTKDAIEAAGNEIRCELGAIVLAAWMFDDEMVDAVIWQERPDDCPEESRLLTQGLYAADTLINLGERGWRPGQNEQMDDLVRELLEPMGVNFERSEEILLLVEGGLAAFAKLI